MELGACVRFDFALVASKLPEIFHALGLTLFMWIVGLIGAALLGFLVAIARRYGPRWLNLALGAYVEVFRGTPFLIQLFLLYFGGPYAGTVSGAMNMWGNYAGFVAPVVIGYLLKWTGNWNLTFYVSACVYLTGIIFWSLLDPVTPIAEARAD